MRSASPRIVEIAVNDRTLHQGQMVLVKITTTPGRHVDVPARDGTSNRGPAHVAGSVRGTAAAAQRDPGRSCSTATIRSRSSRSTAAGKTTVYALPMRLEP
jgi:hypothetical protein